MGLADSFSLSSIIIAVAALFFLIGATLMSSPSAEQRRASRIGFWIGSGLIWFSLINFCCTVLEMSLTKRYLFAAVGSALIGVFVVWIMSIIGVVPRETAVAQPANQSNPSQNCTGNCSFNQSGGTIIQNLNEEPQRLKFEKSTFDALISQMQPIKPVKLVGIGNTEADQQVIQEYASSFVGAGYQVQLITIGMAIPAPNKKISLSTSDGGYKLMLAPSAF